MTKLKSPEISLQQHILEMLLKSCSQSLHALRLLRAHGMCDAAIQTIFKSVVVAKLTNVAGASRGFSKVSDRQLIDAFLQWSKCCRYYATYLLPLIDELCDTVDEQL